MWVRAHIIRILNNAQWNLCRGYVKATRSNSKVKWNRNASDRLFQLCKEQTVGIRYKVAAVGVCIGWLEAVTVGETVCARGVCLRTSSTLSRFSLSGEEIPHYCIRINGERSTQITKQLYMFIHFRLYSLYPLHYVSVYAFQGTQQFMRNYYLFHYW